MCRVSDLDRVGELNPEAQKFPSELERIYSSQDLYAEVKNDACDSRELCDPDLLSE